MSNLVTAEEERLCKKALVYIFNSKALFYGMPNKEKTHFAQYLFHKLAADDTICQNA